MNSTPKDRVLAIYPQAYVAGGAGAWTVYKHPTPLGTPSLCLGRGGSASRAWEAAAKRLPR